MDSIPALEQIVPYFLNAVYVDDLLPEKQGLDMGLDLEDLGEMARNEMEKHIVTTQCKFFSFETKKYSNIFV